MFIFGNILVAIWNWVSNSPFNGSKSISIGKPSPLSIHPPLFLKLWVVIPFNMMLNAREATSSGKFSYAYFILFINLGKTFIFIPDLFDQVSASKAGVFKHIPLITSG